MADEPMDVLLVRDEEGSIYALPWALVQEARISDEEASIFARLLDDGDVAGFTRGTSIAGSLAELGNPSTMESLRLQMSMERYTKAVEAMSTMLQRASAVQASMTPNLK